MKNEMSQRQLRVAELIKIALVEALQKGKVRDIRLINNYITITRVTISPDLKIANCYVLPFGSNSNKISKEELLEALDVSKYGLRAIVTSKVALKYSPELRFFYDQAFENANDVSNFLQNLGNGNS